VTFCVAVTDAPALRRAAAQLANAIGVFDWEATRCGVRDDLLMLLDPGPLAGVKILETIVDRP